MTILIADKLAPVAADLLEKSGHDVIEEPGLSGDDLVEVLRQKKPHMLIVRSTRVTAQAMDANPALELIVRAGAGYNTIDVEAASERGIFVANCPGKNAVAVAELTMGLVLALDRQIPACVEDVRSGRWNKEAYSQAGGLKGRTLGIIGMGSIGREVAARARAFGMHVMAWSRSLTDEDAADLRVARWEDPRDLAEAADVVTLHVAATPETEHLAGRAFFEAMRPGALFINTSRASVVDEDALRWAMDEKGIRAALDVIEGEPSAKEGDFEHPLADHPSLYLTHHIGASTKQAQQAVAREAARVVHRYADTGRVLHGVNLAERSPATHLLTVRHLDKVGVLAAVLDEVRKADWNVQEMENLIFAGAKAACARIRFDGEPKADVLDRINEHEDIIAASLIAL